MPGTVPVAGHASIIAIEVDPVAAAGIFNTVPEVTSSLDYDSMREETEITPHAAGVDSYITSQVLKRGDLSLEMTYKWANEVHVAMHDHYHDHVTFGMMLIGPDGSAPSSDVVIQSGELKSWKQAGPARNGEYKVTAAFRASGPFKKNGVLYS